MAEEGKSVVVDDVPLIKMSIEKWNNDNFWLENNIKLNEKKQELLNLNAEVVQMEVPVKMKMLVDAMKRDKKEIEMHNKEIKIYNDLLKKRGGK